MLSQSKVRCRPIGAADLEGVADLLARGFPKRPRLYWEKGLDRLANRAVPEGMPRFGFLMEHAGTVVGTILVIAQTITHAGEPFVRCNLASWFVDPAFRSNAAMLSMMPLRRKDVTFLNISAAPNTWATIEAQGFRRYTFGQVLALPILARGDPARRVTRFDARNADFPEAGLLADHAAAGCASLVGHGPEGPAPFVLLPVRARQGRVFVPAMQVVFCRSLGEVARYAAPLGRLLLRAGRPFLLVDAAEEDTDLPGPFLRGRARKYVRGDRQPSLGDLAYTEFTIFGP